MFHITIIKKTQVLSLQDFEYGVLFLFSTSFLNDWLFCWDVLMCLAFFFIVSASMMWWWSTWMRDHVHDKPNEFSSVSRVIGVGFWVKSGNIVLNNFLLLFIWFHGNDCNSWHLFGFNNRLASYLVGWNPQPRSGFWA